MYVYFFNLLKDTFRVYFVGGAERRVVLVFVRLVERSAVFTNGERNEKGNENVTTRLIIISRDDSAVERALRCRYFICGFENVL